MTDTGSNQSFCPERLEAERVVLLPLSDHCMTDDSMDIWYAIIDKEGHTSIGMIGMVRRHPEWKNTGLWIVIPDEQNRREGYGMEALGLMERYIFDSLEYQRIAVQIAEYDQDTVCFFKKAGYKLEGVQELGYFCDGMYCDLILLRLLRKECINLKSSSKIH